MPDTAQVDTDTERELSAAEAVATIDRVSALEEPLRRRTEGVTWVVWGLVTATFLATQAALGDAVPWEVWLLVWLPAWLGVGVLGTEMVWRIASLTASTLAPDARRTGVAFLLGAMALTAIMTAVYPFSGPDYVPQLVTLLVLPWAFLAAVQWRRLTDAGRTLTLVLAVVILGLGVPTTLGFGALSYGSALLVALVAGGVPFVAGTWWTLRG